MIRCAPAPPFLVLAAASLALAEVDTEVRLLDTVVWKNPAGVAITSLGTITQETPEEVTIKTSGATFPVKRAVIVDIKPRRLPDAVYRALRQDLDRRTGRAERAQLHRKIGLWCLKPVAVLGGEPPLPERAFDHLYKAVQVEPSMKDLYPHLLGLLAQEREARGGEPTPLEIEREVDIYMLARAGGFADPEIDFRLGELLHLRLQRTAEAVPYLEKVLGGSFPNRFLRRRARGYLAEIHLDRGEIDKALALFSVPPAAVSKDPALFEAHFELGRILAARGTAQDRPKARLELQKALELQPDHPEVARELSALDFADGKLRPAAVRLQRLVDAGTASPAVRVDLALILIQEGRLAKAQALVGGLLGEAPPGPEAPPGEAPAPADAPGAADAAAAPPLPPPELSPALRSRALLARGLILDARGEVAKAVAEYRSAVEADPSSPQAALLLACAELRSGNPPGARALLGALMKDHAGRPGVFAAAARLLADLEIAEGRPRKAASLLEYAAEIDARDPLLQRKLGTLLLGINEHERAYVHLDAARKLIEGRDPALLNALGCYHYRRGEHELSAKVFETVKGLVPRPTAAEGKPAPPPPAERLYAELGEALSNDARRLEVWLDDFNRDASSDLARNWREIESFGIAVSLRDSKLLFEGTQDNDPTGVSMAVRDEPAENCERVSVRLKFEPAAGPVRAGVRLESAETRGGPPSAGLVFFRDRDGSLSFARKTTRSGWEDAKPTGDAPQKDKLAFPGGVKWPEDGQFHTLTIRRAAGVASQATSTFDLLLDAQPIAQNVAVEGLRGKVFLVGVSGQVEAKGVPYRFEADDFRLYRPRALDVRSTQR